MAGFSSLILEHEPFFDQFHAVPVYININRDDLLSGPGFDVQFGEGEVGDKNSVAAGKHLAEQSAVACSGDNPFQPLVAGKQGAVVKSVCAALTDANIADSLSIGNFPDGIEDFQVCSEHYTHYFRFEARQEAR